MLIFDYLSLYFLAVTFNKRKDELKKSSSPWCPDVVFPWPAILDLAIPAPQTVPLSTIMASAAELSLLDNKDETEDGVQKFLLHWKDAWPMLRITFW